MYGGNYMALIKCKECGKKISSTVKACPHCGMKNKKDFDFSKVKELLKNKYVLAGIVGLVLIAVLVPMFSGTTSGDTIKTSSGKVNIVDNKISLVDYDGGNFTMKIPQGWVVETGGYD